MNTMFINIIFDGPPGPEAPRFIEVEDDAGKSISVGVWNERPDSLWGLRIPYPPMKLDPPIFDAYSKEPKQVLAIMASQSERYRNDQDFRDAVDNVLYECGVRPIDHVELRFPTK